MTTNFFVSTITLIVMAALGSAILLTLVRVARGPSLPDRVVALDVAMYCVIGIIVTYSIRTNHPVLLDVAIVLVLIGFVGTLAFASYLKRHARNE